MLTAAASPLEGRAIEAVVMGGSLGALEALGVLVPRLAATAKQPVVVVVHLPPGRRSLIPPLFRERTPLSVEEVEDKQPVTGGTVWFAPADYHLLIERDRTFSLSVDPPVLFSRPSINVLFESAADVYADRLLAIVLTGANEDGAEGARAIRRAGGVVFVQDPASALGDRMPRAAIECADPQLIAPLEAIGDLLNLLTGNPA